MRILSISMTLFLVAGPLSGQDAAELVRRGDDAYRRMDNSAALAFYQRATDLAPHAFEPLSRLARLQNDLGRLALRRSDSSEGYYRNALVVAETLVARCPDRAESWFLLALCHGSLIPFKTVRERLYIGRDVETNLRKALTLDPSHAMSYVLLGIYYRGAARLTWWERTLVNTLLGMNIIGTLDDSEKALRTAIALDPRNSYAWYELAGTLRAKDRTIDATAALDSVLALPVFGAREQLQNDEARARLGRWRASSTSSGGGAR